MTLWTMLAAVAAQVDGPGWEQVHSDADGAYSVERGSIVRAGGDTRFRFQMFQRIRSPDGTRSLVIQGRMNCAARTILIERTEGYDDLGALLRAVDVPAAQRRANPFGTGPADIALHRRICG